MADEAPTLVERVVIPGANHNDEVSSGRPWRMRSRGSRSSRVTTLESPMQAGRGSAAPRALDAAAVWRPRWARLAGLGAGIAFDPCAVAPSTRSRGQPALCPPARCATSREATCWTPSPWGAGRARAAASDRLAPTPTLACEALRQGAGILYAVTAVAWRARTAASRQRSSTARRNMPCKMDGSSWTLRRGNQGLLNSVRLRR